MRGGEWRRGKGREGRGGEEKGEEGRGGEGKYSSPTSSILLLTLLKRGEMCTRKSGVMF